MIPPPHHAARGFRNPHHAAGHGGWPLVRFLYQWWRQPVRGEPAPSVRPDLSFLKGNRSVPTATWLGHASYLIQLDGLNLITDPHLSQRASPLAVTGPARLQPPPIAHDDLPAIDVVLLSHDHYDHCDGPTLRWLADTFDPAVIAPLGHRDLLAKWGCRRVTELDWWTRSRRGGLTVTAVPAQHFSGRGAGDRNQRLWCGFVFEADGKRAYFAGDTGYSPDFAAIGERCGPVDLALIPIGAYSPRDYMGPVHIDPGEAVRIHQDVRAKCSLAMHWGTFRLTLEPLDEPPRKLAEARQAAGLDASAFQVPALGETVYW